jgi:hypothetical protein
MKRNFFMLACILFFAAAAQAQVNLGVKGGTTISKIDGKSFKDEFRYGYHLGGFVELGFGGKLSLQPEVLFNQYQTRVDTAFRAVYQNVSLVKLNYLSIPVILNYKLGNAISLQAGPQFGVLMNKDNNVFENSKQAFQDGDFSLLGGVQLNVSKFLVSGRYVVGLNNLNEIDNRDQWKSQAIQLSVGLRL